MRQAKDILNLLDKYKTERPGIDIKLQHFSSGEELIKSVEDGQVFNLYLLDIMMPELNGIELARRLRKRGDDIPLVFLTASVDYALDAFRVSAVQYILKPVSAVELFPVLDKVAAALKREEEHFFVVMTSEQTVKIPSSSIIYVELFKRTLMIYHENGKQLQSKTIRMPFADAIAPLMEDGRFLCAHKSFVINMSHVEKLTANSFVMKNNAELPIPRYKYAEAKAKYFTWLSQQGVGMLGDRKS